MGHSVGRARITAPGRLRIMAYNAHHAAQQAAAAEPRNVKVTAYFTAIRVRPDRALIREEWIERAMSAPLKEQVQADGRIRRWAHIPEMQGRYLRVVLLPDGETVHNAFFDRRFQP